MADPDAGAERGATTGDRTTTDGRTELGIVAVLTSVLGGPIAWALHLGVSYFVVALACTTGWRAGVGLTLAIVTLAFALASAGAGVLAFRRWRDAGGGERTWEMALDEPRGHGAMLWMLGMLLSALFTIVIVFAGLPPLFMSPCAA